tara:strand:+ start:244 stop:447 length:204 start_codon:yes stop_codon:yes gene_type:complete
MPNSKAARNTSKIVVHNQGGGNKKGGAPPTATGFMNGLQWEHNSVQHRKQPNYLFTFKSPNGGFKIR